MTHDYGAKLAAINWAKLDPIDAQAIYTLTVTACRATRGGCFCGCHVTPLDETRPAPELPRLAQEEAQRIGREVHEDYLATKAETERIGKELNEHSRRKARRKLPRKVEPGSTLQVGARYRITEIASWDRTPENKVGHVFTCDSSDGWAGTVLTPSWSTSPAWLVADGTYVTGLELVAEAPAKEEP